ncbi:tyrosine-type recombinase/integrase [Methylomonas sp. AM2-LC]|jgi:site-specific recombinase XerD|uniref:tyrosine-type recombinase/integrase n=1 Tax=Methylomonas sp. AM2-LC TaxID=3153301 RepID=UPI003265C35F
MPTKIQPTGLSRLALLVDAPLSCIATPYIEALQKQQYAKHTIELYLKCIIRFSCWLKTENLDLSSVTPKLIDHYLNDLMLLYPATVDARYFIRMDRAALRCLLILLPKQQVQITKKPIEAELDRFSDYLLNICGISPQTCVNRRQHICAFLKHRFDTAPPDISQISGDDIDAFFQHLALKWQPASLREVSSSVRSYLRFLALQGKHISVLLAFIPKISSCSHATLPKVLTDIQVDAFLKAFDCSYPVGMRDYAIARCLLDLGLRGQETAYLTLDSVDWRNATLTININKSKRVQQLPLSTSTGQAIAQYLFAGRPQTTSRILFIRHRAPFNQPLGVPAIRSAMNRAFVRCGLRSQFCNTHALRSTTATRLQKAGASIKEIADLLRHQSLDTAKTYARVDIELLRTVALPWPGSCS